jgi:hypothetical protein
MRRMYLLMYYTIETDRLRACCIQWPLLSPGFALTKRLPRQAICGILAINFPHIIPTLTYITWRLIMIKRFVIAGLLMHLAGAIRSPKFLRRAAITTADRARAGMGPISPDASGGIQPHTSDMLVVWRMACHLGGRMGIERGR